MKAIQLNEYGSADNFEAVDIVPPTAGPGQIRINVDYAGLRWGDIMGREGRPSKATPTPFVPGQEVAGHVDEVGPGVTGYAVGDAVVAMVARGGFAEYTLAEPGGKMPVWKVPGHVRLDSALAYPANMITAYHCVYTWSQVKEGETVLVHNAAGGVGLLIVQILKRRFRDVTVIGICGSEEKAQLLRDNGCDHTINRRTQDYVAEVERIRGPKATGFPAGGEQGGGVDVSLNGVAGATMKDDPQVIRKRGRWVIYGYAGADSFPAIDTAPITYDGITIMPFSQVAWWGTDTEAEAVRFTHDWMATEELILPTIWPLDRVADAQRALEAGETTGKVVFTTAAV
ncbi:quinone oxidoreductase family protein [Tsukamurella tyrosinosolvens]|uniref:quinone oxidoreductase family protein n=1 Tax=Tsukamurella tyrosinosolvens TaxID=57704 RepID=UPI00079701D7|nr:zinc-binding dehydrogenase [Tsukamurella tyrosinosolvens]KXP08423.1 hypothetical protein AXK59_23775 [Tsukamurella tyrosinosolvens]